MRHAKAARDVSLVCSSCTESQKFRAHTATPQDACLLRQTLNMVLPLNVPC